MSSLANKAVLQSTLYLHIVLNSSFYCFFCISAGHFIDFICFMYKNFHSSLHLHTAITRNPVAVWISISQLKGKGTDSTYAALGSCVMLLSLLCYLILDILYLRTKGMLDMNIRMIYEKKNRNLLFIMH